MRLVGMAGQALPDPVAEIAKAPDRADLVAAPVVLDYAFADAIDIGRVIVEIADQRPHGFQRLIEHGAVIRCRHIGLPRGDACSLKPDMASYPCRTHPIPDGENDGG